MWSAAPEDEDAAPEDEDEAGFLGWVFFFWSLFVLHFSVAGLRLSSPPVPSGCSTRSLPPRCWEEEVVVGSTTAAEGRFG